MSEKEKILRPRKARLLGSILPTRSKFLQTAEYEDFNTERTNGSNTTFKNMTSSTMNLGLIFSRSELTVSTQNVYVGETATITATLRVNEVVAKNEKVFIVVNGLQHELTTNNSGVVSYSETFSSGGNVPVVVYYKGNVEKHYAAAEPVTPTLNILKRSTSISATNQSCIVRDNVTVPITLKDNRNSNVTSGTVRVKDGSTIVKEISVTGSSLSFKVKPTSAGTTTYTLEYIDNELVYENSTGTVKVTASKLNTTISASNVTCYAGDNITVPITLKDSNNNSITSGKVTVKQGSTTVATINASSNIEWEFVPNTVGETTYTITYGGDNRYQSSSTSMKITCNTISTTVIASNKTAYYGDTVNIPVNVKDSNNKNVPAGTIRLINLAQNRQIGELTIGTDTLQFPFNYEEGTYQLRVSFIPASNKYASSQKDITVTIKQRYATISASSKTCNVGDTVTIPITVKSGGSNITSGTIKVKKDNVVIETLVIGTDALEFSVTPTTSGNVRYTIDLESNMYTASSITITVSAGLKSATINNASTSCYLNESYNISSMLKVIDSNTNANVTEGTLTLKEGSTTLNTWNLANTTPSYSLTPDSTGTKTLKLEFSGVTYASTSGTITLQVIAEDTTTTLTTGQILFKGGETEPYMKVVVKDTSNAKVNKGQVEIIASNSNCNVSGISLGTFSMSAHDGELHLARSNLKLNDLWNALEAKEYLFFTTYTINAIYTGAGRYNNSSQTADSLKIKSYGNAMFCRVDVKSQSTEYDIETAIQIVDYWRYDGLVTEDDGVYNIGNVQQGKIIYIGAIVSAMHSYDSRKTDTSYSTTDNQAVGGVTYNVSTQVNNGTITRQNSERLNGPKTLYNTPCYRSHIVSENVGDTVILWFEWGANANFYHDGAKHGIKYKVVA